MNMNTVIFLCILLAVCTQALQLKYVKKARSTPLPSTVTPTTTSTSPQITTSATSAATSPPTPAPTVTSTSHTTENSSLNVTSTTEKPAPPVTQNYDRILESTKKGLTAFALEFQKCAFNSTGTSKNILFSPVNVAGILATLLLGSEGETKYEILHTVGLSTGKNLSEKENEIHLALGSLFQNFISEAHDNPATTVEIAQCIFLKNGTSVKDSFRNLSQTVYKNDIVEVDFSSKTIEATDIINKWIDNKTHHRIEKLIEHPLGKDTKMILSNTLFFNGEWEFPFLNETNWKPFYAESGIYSVKMMANNGEAYLLRDMVRNYSALGLPYKGGNIIMYFILPKLGHSLAEFMQNLSEDDLNDIATNSTKVDDISYEIPFMSINDQIHLNNILETMGIKSVFSAAHANLSNIADNVFVSKIIHKANLDITEAGSTGSASSLVQIETKFPKEPFIANRPFMCFVYHRYSRLISFWGTVNLPVPNKPQS